MKPWRGPKPPEWCQKAPVVESGPCLLSSIRLSYAELERVTDGDRTRDLL